MAELRLELLGGLQITCDGQPLPRLISNKAPALLCYLAVTRRAHSRLALASLLWGELPEPDAATNLRTVLSSLRRHVGEHLLISRQTIAFNHKADYWLDVDAFQTIAQHPLPNATNEDYRQLQAAVDRYHGDLLEGFTLRGAPLFEEWLLRQREWLRRLAMHGMQQLVDYHSAQRDYPLAIDLAARLLIFEPWQEETQRQLMRLYAESGRRSAALLQYELCRRALSAELGIAPDAETTALYEAIREGWRGPAGDEQPAPLVLPQAEPPPLAHPLAEQIASDAERRQVTVLSYSLADMLALSRHLDPEALHEVLLAFQQTCDKVIVRFEGRGLSQSANRMLACFGYPVAHEDAAIQAVQAALAIIEATSRLGRQIQARYGARLSVLIGIHTGIAVLGGGAGLVGETPEIAGQLLDLGLRDTVVISATTYRLTQGQFSCHVLDSELARANLEATAYRVLNQSPARSRLEAAILAGLTPLVGRSQELGLLFEHWQQVVAGQGQAILLSGECGIGKSRLVQVLKQRVGDKAATWMECRCSPHHHDAPLYPVTDMLQRLLGCAEDEPPAQQRARLALALSERDLSLPDTLPVLARLLRLDDTPQQAIEIQRTLHALVDALLLLAARQPVLLIFEDVHHADPATLRLIGMLIDQGPTAAICTVLTARPEFRPPWSMRSQFQTMTISRLAQYQVELMARQLASDRQLSEAMLQQIVRRADGVPLFVEELVKVLLNADQGAATNGSPSPGQMPPEPSIPATLHDSLMARLDGLGTGKLVAQIGAVIGREFSYQLLLAVAPLDEAALREELSRLVGSELLYQRGLLPQATFIFRHALIQELAYSSLLQTTRQHYRCRIAAAHTSSLPSGLLLYESDVVY